MVERIKRYFGARPLAPAQRRQYLRAQSEPLDVTCWVGLHPFKGVVSDISAGGLRLGLSRPIPTGTTLTVRFEGSYCGDFDTNVISQVKWCRPGLISHEIGVAFSDGDRAIKETWVSPFLEKAGLTMASAYERRRSRRVTTRMEGTLHGAMMSAPNTVKVLDLGEGGALVNASRELDPSVYVQLGVAGRHSRQNILDVQGCVLRSRRMPDGTFLVSLAFNSEKHNEDLVRLLTYLASSVA